MPTISSKQFNDELEEFDPSHRPAKDIHTMYRKWCHQIESKAEFVVSRNITDIAGTTEDCVRLRQEFYRFLNDHPAKTANLDRWLREFDPKHRPADRVRQLYVAWINYLKNAEKASRPFSKRGYFGKLYPGMPTQLDHSILEDQLRQQWFKQFLRCYGAEHIALKIASTYWLERLDPKHRKADIVARLYQEWARDLHCHYAQADFAGKQQLLLQHKIDFLPPLAANVKSLRTSYKLKQAFKAYLNEIPATEKEAKITYPQESNGAAAYNGKVTITNQTLYWADEPTKCIDTMRYSGKEKRYAAYIIDVQGNLYIHPHTKGAFHHSSFIGGKPVLCAGMIQVVNGKIRTINSNSGHYKPRNVNLALAVDLLSKKGLFEDDNNQRSHSFVSRFFFTGLNWLKLPGRNRQPTVSLTYRSPLLMNLATKCLRSRFRPIYWLGRALDEAKVPLRFSLKTYKEWYVKRYAPQFFDNLSNLESSEDGKGEALNGSMESAEFDTPWYRSCQPFNVSPSGSSASLKNTEQQQYLPDKALDSDEKQLVRRFLTSTWKHAQNRQAILSAGLLLESEQKISNIQDIFQNQDNDLRLLHLQQSSHFERRRINHFRAMITELKMIDDNASDSMNKRKIYNAAIKQLSQVDSESVLTVWQNEYRNIKAKSIASSLYQPIMEHRIFLHLRDKFVQRLQHKLDDMPEQVSRHPCGFFSNDQPKRNNKRQALAAVITAIQQAPDLSRLHEVMSDHSKKPNLLLHQRSGWHVGKSATAHIIRRCLDELMDAQSNINAAASAAIS